MAAQAKQLGSPLRPYDDVHGRHYDFTELEELGREFMSAIAAAFVKYSSTVAAPTAQGIFSTTVGFLRWIKANQQQLSAFVSMLRADYRQCHSYTWEEAIALWRAAVIGEDGLTNVVKYNKIKTLNTAVKRLAAFGVLPKVYLLGASRQLRASRPTRTLAEITPNNSVTLSAEILDKALLGATEKGIELQVKRDFLKSLINETGTIVGTAEEHAKLLMKVNADRLAAVRRCAEKDFSKWVAVWNEGQGLLAKCDLSYKEICKRIYPHNRKGEFWHQSVFPENDPTRSLSRLLKYFAEHPEYRGRMVYQHRSIACAIQSELARFGGPEIVQKYLFPSLELTTAVMVLILCDTGANVEVARTLPADCLENSENPGYKIIKGNKMRAKGKLIADELPTRDGNHDIGCVQAILTYQEVSQSMRKLASKNDSSLLFLSTTSAVKSVSPIRWSKAFKLFLSRHSEISHLPIQSRMIRPSVLMQAEFENQTGIIAAAALADHTSLHTTHHYVARYPTKVVWERMMREFQSLFQAVSIYSIGGAAEKLGLSAKHVRQLFGEACRNGLGVACIDPKGGLQPNSKKGKTCTQLENCPSCPNRIVVATVENLRDLILFNHQLEKSRKEWEVTRPERWARVWLPWLVFTQVVMELASRGRTASHFGKARLIATTMIERGVIHFPPLW
jgi:hypothetical protein